MPTYLVHGFRWPRPLIRIHIILQNLDDAAAEWLCAPETHSCMLDNFNTIYPEQMQSLSSLRFIEQYDPDDLNTKSQPYAYVCDQVHEVSLGVDIDEVRGKGVANEAWAALVDLRDKVAPGEKVAWFVVVNGDLERWAPPVGEGVGVEGSISGSQLSPQSATSSVAREEVDEYGHERRNSKSFKKWFSPRKAKSSKDLRSETVIRTVPPRSPPLPNNPHIRNTAISPTNGRASLPSNGRIPTNGKTPAAVVGNGRNSTLHGVNSGASGI